jgi:hypothetical protein
MSGPTAGSAVPAGRARTLAQVYRHFGEVAAAARAAIDTLLRMTDSVLAIAVRRQARTGQTGRCAVLYPAIAEAARRIGANMVGLIDVGCSAGLNLNVDRVGVTYSNGQVAGRPVISRTDAVFDRGRPAHPGAGDAQGRGPGRR